MEDLNRSIWLGFDPREADAYAVARASAQRRLTQPIKIRGVVLANLQECGLYRRPIEWRGNVMWDTISDAPMATEFACSRFLVPHLAVTGWALFMDCDVLVRGNLMRVFDGLDHSKAVYCVKHDYRPTNAVKMDGQRQVRYNRKLWSSFCLFNVDHPSNKALTVDYVNSVPGRVLHAFNWLPDDEIGELGQEWNWIPGHSSDEIDPKCVHFSEGGPWFAGYENVKFADEWRKELAHWAA